MMKVFERKLVLNTVPDTGLSGLLVKMGEVPFPETVLVYTS